MKFKMDAGKLKNEEELSRNKVVIILRQLANTVENGKDITLSFSATTEGVLYTLDGTFEEGQHF